MRALMNQQQKELFLDLLPSLLKKYTLSTICRFYPITMTMLRKEIAKSDYLHNLYIEHQEKVRLDARQKLRGRKYNVNPHYSNEGKELFQKDLNMKGVKQLALAIINGAIADDDKNFFTTEWSSMWQYFATGCIDDTKEYNEFKRKVLAN